MKSRKPKTPRTGLDVLGGMTVAEALEVYRTVYRSRRIDDRQILLKKMGRAHFQINGAGHELAGAVGARHLRRGHDWFILYYRDRGMATGLGFTAEEQLMEATGAAAEVSSGGRQMPNHWTRPEWNVLTPSSPTGTQYLHAVGVAEAGQIIRSQALDLPAAGDEIVYVSSGEGTTSQGEFWEALNTASLRRLPVLFSVQDNEYAISVHVKEQTAGGSISDAFAAFPGLTVIRADGTDLADSERAWRQAVDHL
ncbi:MAG: dehydrogenase, partial [Deltaproteobacteria bacterium]|nr:dehydrogenase [Deltaproteobacteria bacterium]